MDSLPRIDVKDPLEAFQVVADNEHYPSEKLVVDNLALKVDKTKPIRIVTGTDSLVAADNTKIIECNSGTNFSFTIDQMFAGFTAEVVNINTGDVTLAAGSGVTLRNDTANRKLTTQWKACKLYFRSATECVLIGTLEV